MQVLLFTNKETTPQVFAALAASTQREIGASFATVHERESAILDNFKVKAVGRLIPMISCTNLAHKRASLIVRSAPACMGATQTPNGSHTLCAECIGTAVAIEQHIRIGGDVDLSGLKSLNVAGVSVDSGSFQ